MEVRESQKARSEAIKVAKSQTLCWDCKHATDSDKCPWASDFTPVEGWWAVRSKARYYVSACGNTPVHWRVEDTYCVLMCPLFERTSYRAGLFPLRSEGHADIYSATNTDMRRLVSAIILQAVSDWELVQRGKLSKTVSGEGVVVKASELIAFFNSRRFASMLSAVSNLSPETVRKRLEVPDALC